MDENYCIARLLGRSTAGSLHPRLLRKRRGKERGKKKEADSQDPADSEMNLESLESSRIPFLSPFVSLPHLAHGLIIYRFFMLLPCSANDFYRVTDESARSSSTSDDTVGSSPLLLLFGQSRARSRNVNKSFAPPFDYGSPV